MKAKIDDLRDYAELAQASYFYFDLEGYELKENNIKLTLNEIISLKYNGKMAGKKEQIGNEYHFIDKKELNGEFSEMQTNEFTKRYKIYFRQPNTASGFSATLFYDAQKDRFIVGFRGTEGFLNRDIIQDIALSANVNIQSFGLLDFLMNIGKIIHHYNKPIIFVGHSLGGYLAQWALIYCDDKYKDLLRFSPKEVYTFNSPSIYGWNFPNIILNPNTIKILQEVFGKLSIDTSTKLTHIYDDGGIKIIASAQYGSQNRLPIYTGQNSHSIATLTQTLYLYSYLLNCKENQSKIANKDLSQSIDCLNKFMESIIKAFSPISNRINKANNSLESSNNAYCSLSDFEHCNTADKKPKPTYFLIAFIENILYTTSLEKEMDSFYIKLHTNENNIIDKILLLDSKGFYPKMLDENDIKNFNPKQCNLAERRAIFKCQPFIIIDKNGISILDNDSIESNKHKFSQLFKYNSNLSQCVLNNDSEIFFKAKISMMKDFLYGDYTKIAYIKDLPFGA